MNTLQTKQDLDVMEQLQGIGFCILILCIYFFSLVGPVVLVTWNFSPTVLKKVCYMFFATNYHNYARYMVRYLLNLINIEDSHPGV